MPADAPLAMTVRVDAEAQQRLRDADTAATRTG